MKIWFRGKAKCDVANKGELVYGYYIHLPVGRAGKPEHLIQTIREDGRIGLLVAVEPETVERLAGVENGNDWYENCGITEDKPCTSTK